MSILNKILKTFVGDKSKKDIRAIQYLVDQIKKNQIEFESISNDELRDKTSDFKKWDKKNPRRMVCSIRELKFVPY